jgi:8-oxo-dGTP diphosphatase
MKTLAIVAGLVMKEGRVLMLKRRRDRRHAGGKWEPVCGFFEEHEAAEVAVVREVFEETGIQVDMVRPGDAFELYDDGANWIIKPFLLRQRCTAPIVLDGEHEAFVWATPDEVLEMDCVGGMAEDLAAVGVIEPASV